ncbi:MAG: hypothetical protein COW02_05490 [Comamonadaceae bacterium CG12_big_fil_rev_8_21_14_0_65_59_15]|nr:MAG: hypothetical protein COW02_05490 [Comamonadaceae bacterium CG12_big_fil_rev_8_21_14_0_65_59_15]
MAARAEDYRWSSAAAHCGLHLDPLINPDSPRQQQLATVANWSNWLAQVDDAHALNTLRLHANKGLPCGDERFVVKLSGMAGRSLEPKPRGRPRMQMEEKG